MATESTLKIAKDFSVVVRLTARCLAAVVLVASGFAVAADAPPAEPENTLYLDLEDGRVVIQMRPDLAPNHVARIKHLARGGYYDGMVFHRVIAGFMAQTGDPTGTGSSGSGRKLKAEFTRTPQVRGAVAMARGGGKDSADSQWFIVLGDTHRSDLDGKYTMWGQVVSGMEFVDKINKGNESRNGAVKDPDRLVRMQVAADTDRPLPSGPDVLGGADDAATARNFSAVEFRCQAFSDSPGLAAHSALARLWAHGYLAGHGKAKSALSFTDAGEDSIATALKAACQAKPAAFLFEVSGQDLTKTSAPLPSKTAAFPAATYACKDYVAAHAENAPQADFADLWGIAFIQGLKNVAQPGMEIPFDVRGQLMGAVANACTKNPEVKFVDLTALVAEKVKLK